jgi:hypothetical protein
MRGARTPGDVGRARGAWAVVAVLLVAAGGLPGLLVLTAGPSPSAHPGSFDEASSPLIVSPPTPSVADLDPGQSIVLSVNVSGGSGPGTYSYRWYEGAYLNCTGDTSPVGSGAINATLNVSYAYGDLYYCYSVTDTEPKSATSPTGTLVSENASLVAGGIAPTSPTVDQGNRITLTARPSGGVPPYSVEWFSNATGSSSCNSTGPIGTGLTIAATLTASTCYSYRLTDSSAGTPAAVAWSPGDYVAVDLALAAGGVDPIAPTIDAGESINLTASPSGGTGPGTYTIQWYAGFSSTCPEAMVPAGTNSSVFTASPRSTTDVCYSVHDVSYGGTTVYSLTDTVSVNTKLAAKESTPIAPGIDVGQSLTLTANASGGTPAYSYKWYVGLFANCSASTAAQIPGQTASNLTLTPGGSEYVCYSVRDQSASSPTIYSPGDLVTVWPAVQGGSPSPSSPTIDKGSSVKLTANPIGGTPPATFDWFHGVNSSCSGDTTPAGTGKAVTVSPISPTVYCYEVIDASAAGSKSALSSTVEVTVNTALQAGPITPTNPTVDGGQPVLLTSNATGGTPVITYQWYSGASASGCTTPIAGATSATYRAVPAGTMYYCYSVSDGSTNPPTTRSTADLVSTDPTLVAGPITPMNPAVDLGQSVNLTSNVTGGDPPYTVTWLTGTSANCSNDTTVVGSGTMLPLTPSSPAEYCYRGTDSLHPAGVVLSAAVLLAVNLPLGAGPVNTTSSLIDKGQTALLGATPSGGTQPYHYHWYSETAASSDCAGGTAIRFGTGVHDTVSPTTATYYCYIVTDSSNGTPEEFVGSATVELTVGPTLSVGPISPSTPTIYNGSRFTLTANVTGGSPPYTFAWYSSTSSKCPNGSAIPGATSITYSAVAIDPLYYCVVIGDRATGLPPTTTSNPDYVGVAPPPPPMFLGFPLIQGYAFLGGLLGVVALIVVAVILHRRRRGRGQPHDYL